MIGKIPATNNGICYNDSRKYNIQDLKIWQLMIEGLQYSGSVRELQKFRRLIGTVKVSVLYFRYFFKVLGFE